MDKTFIKWLFKPEIKNPILIEGLPGFGDIGRLVTDSFIKFLNCKRFAELYSPFFPDYVVIDENGVCRPPRYEFYVGSSTSGQSFIVLTGDIQPIFEDVNAHYELCGEILNLAEEFGCNTLITIGGLPASNPSGEVYVATTSARLTDELIGRGGLLYGRGKIIGATGLLLGLAKARGWTGICLLGATTGLEADRNAALSVFRFLSRILDLEKKKAL